LESATALAALQREAARENGQAVEDCAFEPLSLSTASGPA
jgi:hypothetical protein